MSGPSQHAVHIDRLAALDRLVTQAQLDALILPGRGVITQYGFLQWATGFCPVIRQGALIVRPLAPPHLFFTSGSDAVLARAASPIADIMLLDDLAEHLGAVLMADVAIKAGARIGVVGLADIVSAAMMDAWRAALPNAVFVDATPAVLHLKAVKDPGERQMMRATAAIADDALDAIVARLRSPASTLAEAAGEGDRVLRAAGAHETLIYVSKGPHFLHRPTRETVDAGDLLTIYVELSNPDGYWIELARVAARGGLSASRSAVVAATREAMAITRDALRPGGTGGGARDRIARVIENAGYASGLWLGHGVGIDHDLPIIGRGDATVLREGMTIAVHPHLVAGSVGASIGDTFIVTAEGGEPMSRWPDDLISL